MAAGPASHRACRDYRVLMKPDSAARAARMVGMVGAFVISFYFSTNTIIYYLMRREVDATEPDDVYLEQSDEDFGESIPQPGVVAESE